MPVATPAQDNAPQQVSPGTDGAPATYVINLREADIRTLSEQVSEITGRTLVLDPNVTGTVTVISTQPLDRDGVWELFQSVLAVQGFAAIPSGNLWRIVPQANVKEGGATLTDQNTTGRLDVITRLVPLRNFPAATAVGALRPLVASYGYIESVPETNTLVITDTAENVRRIEGIARSLDAGDGQQVHTIRIRNAEAAAVATVIDNLLSSRSETGTLPTVTVDTRANLLLIRSDADTFARVEEIVADLDVPGRPRPSIVPVTRVYRLRFADATSLADVLRGLTGGGGGATNAVARAIPPFDTGAGTSNADAAFASTDVSVPPGETGVIGEPVQAQDEPPSETPTATAAPPVTSLGNEEITIQPVVETNAVVVRAREEVQRDISALIRQLDQRRPQVLIEAAIVEVSGDISEQLGVQLGFGHAAPPGGFAATSFSPSGPTLGNILSLLGVREAAAISPTGLSIGLSREDKYGVLVQALGTSSKANLLSTPSITTLDNQPAEIIVGQNVPFRTGSFTTDGNSTNPFTTIERRDVGITLRVVPRVNQGDVVQLDVSQEVSSLTNTNVSGAADLVTNRRSIKTTVLADNGGTIVLGGLITDDRQQNRSEVPGLGKIPVLGRLFRSNSEGKNRRTLFVFLRPTILRSRSDVATVSGNRFLRLKAIEANPGDRGSLLTEPKPVRRLPVEINGLY